MIDIDYETVLKFICIGIAAMLLLAYLGLAWIDKHAVEGYEDDTGWHAGRQKRK